MRAKLSLAIVLFFAGLANALVAQSYVPVMVSAGTPVPVNLVTDSGGNIYSFTNYTLVKTSSSGTATVIANAQTTGATQDYTFTGVTVDGSGNIYAAETRDFTSTPHTELVIKVAPGGSVSTLATITTGGFAGSSLNVNASTLTATSGGTIYTAGWDGTVYQIAPGGAVTVVAPASWFVDTSNQQTFPTVLGVDSSGNPYLTATVIAGTVYHGAIEIIQPTASPIVTRAPQNITGVINATLTLNVDAISTGPLSYQWLRNGVPVPSATGSMTAAGYYGISTAQLLVTTPGVYTAAITASSTAMVTSAPGTVTLTFPDGTPVTAVPQFVNQPQNSTILFGSSAALMAVATCTQPLSYQWYLNGVAIANAAGAMSDNNNGTYTSVYYAVSPGIYTISVVPPTPLSGTVPTPVTSAPALVTTITAGGVPVVAAPTFTAAPANSSFTYGSGVTLTSTVVSALPINYQWQRNGVNIAGATSSSYTATATGVYTLVAATSGGIASQSATVTLANRMGAISSRAAVGTGDSIAIAGFNIASYGTATKRVLIRAVGPSLANLGVSGVLARPVLSIYDSSGRLIATNSGWNNSVDIAAASASVGDFALQSGSADAALLVDLAPGSYTAQVAGLNSTTGVALVEVYEALPDDGHFTGLSTRAAVGTGGNILIGGFVVGGSQPAQLIIRASGPALAQFGVSGGLQQPVVTIYNASGQAVASNTGWSTSSDATKIASASASVGLFPFLPANADSAVIITLPPGAYTAQVSGVNNTSGNALLEVYQVPAGP